MRGINGGERANEEVVIGLIRRPLVGLALSIDQNSSRVHTVTVNPVEPESDLMEHGSEANNCYASSNLISNIIYALKDFLKHFYIQEKPEGKLSSLIFFLLISRTAIFT